MPENNMQCPQDADAPFEWTPNTLSGVPEGGDENTDQTGWEEMLERQRAEQAFAEEARFSSLRFKLVSAIAWVIVLLALLTLCVYGWHLLAPPAWHWLHPEDADRIERVALSIASGVAATVAVAWLFQKR